MTSELSEIPPSVNEEYAVSTAAAVGAAASNLPMRKRKQGIDADVASGDDATAAAILDSQAQAQAAVHAHVEKKLKAEDKAIAVETAVASMVAMLPAAATDPLDPLDRGESNPPMTKAREIRLEQNRKAARESRRRKKIMIEELQRSVIFFSRANSTLKQQNEELQRLLVQAQSQCKIYESGTPAPAPASSVPAPILNAMQDNNAPAPITNNTTNIDLAANAINEQQTRAAQAKQAVAAAQAQAEAQAQMSKMAQQAQAQAAQAAATQAIFESQGFPPAAARNAAQTFVAGAPADNNPLDVTPAPGGDAVNMAATTAAPAAMTVNAANHWPFLMAMAPVANQPATTVDNTNTMAAVQTPAPAQVTAVTTTPAAATNANFQEQALIAMQQQFSQVPQLQTFTVPNPALLQQQAAFMQQMMNFNNVATAAATTANGAVVLTDTKTEDVPTTTTNV
jgi:hypothetical protein